MATYFVIDANNNIVNSVEWDGNTDWNPPQGLTIVLGDGMWRDGWKWDGSEAYDPNPPVVMEAPPEQPPLSLGINKV